MQFSIVKFFHLLAIFINTSLKYESYDWISYNFDWSYSSDIVFPYCILCIND